MLVVESVDNVKKVLFNLVHSLINDDVDLLVCRVFPRKHTLSICNLMISLLLFPFFLIKSRVPGVVNSTGDSI